ncbi:MAG: hypothetical protein KAX37_09885, partial [Opitutaceae bacterium]|nr:hypothetical protein [Opitutaceae bacterium]
MLGSGGALMDSFMEGSIFAELRSSRCSAVEARRAAAGNAAVTSCILPCSRHGVDLIEPFTL